MRTSPPAAPNYVDNYNGGCNSDPHLFQPLLPVGSSLDLCGKSGTYTWQGLSYRNTDWFVLQGGGQTATLECTAEFPLQLIFIWGLDCDNPQYDITTAAECQTATLSRYMGQLVQFWVWVGAQVFTGIPCDADYLLHIDGVSSGIVPANQTTWGQIKAQYR